MSKRDKIPETVEIELPKPFAGSTLYSRSPGSSPSWTGDLSIDLPSHNLLPSPGPILKSSSAGAGPWPG
jgi:hypothetical protein